MVNKVTLLGRVGKDPEVRNFEWGKTASFTLATTSRWTTKGGERQEKTEWHNVKAFGNLTEIVSKYVNKGDLLYVEGSIEYEKYEKDGIQKSTTVIRMTGIDLLPKSEAKASKSDRVLSVEAEDIGTGDLPF